MIHPTAVVDPDVILGENVTVRQFASLTRGARIGRDCKIGPGAHIDGSELRSGVVVGHNVAMGPGFLIDTGAFIGPGVVLCNDVWPKSHRCGWDIDAFLKDGKIAVYIGRYATIGANASILPGVSIGYGAVVGANEAVRRDVPANMLYVGGKIRPLPEVRERMKFVGALRD